jgi:two-component system, NarL family, nitrate/nitrite response regulator NarL
MVSPAFRKTTAIRVLVADQHPVIRIGVENLLQAEIGIKVIGEAGSCNEALSKTQELSPDILLLALNLPGMDGMSAISDVSAETRTILLTNSISRHEIGRAMELSASGLVLKDRLMDNLIAAIRAVSTGKCWIGDHRASSLNEAIPANSSKDTKRVEKKPAATLTPRELEVVSCVVRGSSNRDIAHQFQLSEETVKRHLSNIFEKTGVSTRLELALYAIEHQILISNPS